MPQFILSLSQDRRDEHMLKVAQEQVGYNHQVVIRRASDNRYAACIDITDQKVLFASGTNGIISFTIEQDFSRWCDDCKIMPC